MTPENQKKRHRLLMQWLWMTAAAMSAALVVLVMGTLHDARQADKLTQELARQVELDTSARLLQSIIVALGDAETGQRGYLLTGQRQYLEPYTQAVADLPALFKGLEGMPVHASGFDQQLRALEVSAQQKLAELAETIRLYDSGRTQAALALIQTGAGRSHMESVRAAFVAATDTIRLDRNAASGRIAAALADTRQSAIGTVAAVVACALLAGALVMLLIAAQRRHTLDLAQSEARHRAIVEEQQEMISLSREDGTLTYVNPAYARTLNLDASAMVGRSLFDFVDEGDREAVRAQLRAVMQSGEPASGENRMVTRDGHELWYAWSNSIQWGPHGERLLHSVGRDITQRKHAEDALKATERRLRDLIDVLEHTSDFVVQTDWKGQVQYFNPAARHLLGFSADEPAELHNFAEFNTDETNQRFVTEITPEVKRHGMWVGETTVLGVGHRVVPVSHMVLAHRDAQGRVERYSAVMRDIAHVLAAREALQRQTAWLGAVVEAIPAMVAVIDDQMRYRLINHAFERWLNQDRRQVLGRAMVDVVGQHEYERSLPWARRALAGETVTYENDYPEAREHRQMVFNYVPLRMEDGSIAGLLSVAQDVTLQRDEERRLLSLAERDALTGVLNRAGFNRYLSGCGPSIALLYIDLDKFKPVNDTHGHSVGDELLRQFAERLRAQVRPSDAVARLGGDEFAVVLNDVRALAHAQKVADKIAELARTPFHVKGVTVTVGASVGVALGANEGAGVQGLIERADAALYRAKFARTGCRA